MHIHIRTGYLQTHVYNVHSTTQVAHERGLFPVAGCTEGLSISPEAQILNIDSSNLLVQFYQFASVWRESEMAGMEGVSDWGVVGDTKKDEEKKVMSTVHRYL